MNAHPTLDVEVVYQQPTPGGARTVTVSVPVLSYARDTEGFLRPSYVHDVVWRVAQALDIVSTPFEALTPEALTQAEAKAAEGATEATEGAALPCGCSS